VRAAYAVLAVVLACYAIAAAFGDGATPAADAGYYLVLFGVAASMLARGLGSARERGAWLALGAAVLLWAIADLYSTVVLSSEAVVPIPSVADGLYLAFYPLTFVGVVLLARARLRVIGSTVWLDGVVTALSIAALSGLLLFGPVVRSSGGPPLEVATNIAYPLGDLSLATVIAGFVAVRGIRMGRAWLLMLAALLLFAVTDTIYLYQSAAGTYAEGGILNVGWPLAVLLFGASAWQPAGARAILSEQRHSIVLPVGFGLVSLGLMVLDHFDRLHPAVLATSAASLAAILARFVLTFRISQRLVSDRERQALTDAVTGLRNRRSLMLDLRAALDAPRSGGDVVLVLFDLDGFKEYNDTFGHPAGDLLLVRLAGALEQLAIEEGARAYRMGGDEFCLLSHLEADAAAEPLVARATAALTEHGDGFTIGASAGYTLLAAGDDDIERALRTADDRMYANKNSRRTSALRQTRDVLHAVMSARDPRLAGHLGGVARSAEHLARELGLPDRLVRQVRDAGELHDIGKLAIPDAILYKPGRLDATEWDFMRRHPLIGERIASSAPSLASIAPIIRSHHERWDGTGYPDGLAGDAIPIGAQIVFVCDAYDAMISNRPYRAAMSPDAALEQLEAGAGTQFSPRVVRAFSETRRRRLRTVPSDSSGRATA
jgi:two-component system cell cycle response regulator